MPIDNNHSKPLSAVVSDLKAEAKEFLQTRLQMLRAELRDKLSAWKVALPMLAIAALLAATAFLLLTAALVAALAPLFPGPYAWALALLVVGLAYLLVAAVVGWFGYREMSTQGLTPNRTLRVLKQDQVWFQEEARSQL